MKFAILGAGSTGGCLGGYLAHAGNDVTFLARGENLRALQTRGLVIRRDAADDLVLPEVRACTLETYTDTPDVIFVCFKYGSLQAAIDFARRAAADDFIKGLSEGYDTIIGERGVGLSGGQKQRIALARALAVKPGILVMDDTTSAVDMETEKYIQAQLRQLPYDCTKLIIAQRISSVKDADLILILKDGVVTERGTHQELLRQRGYYYETYCLQNGITPDTAPQEVM